MDQKTIKIIEEALREDSSRQDITTKLLISKGRKGAAEIIAKENAVLCGSEIVEQVFKKIDPLCQIRSYYKDGSAVAKGARIMTINGHLAKLLAAERTALNFLQHLSGVATLTNRFVRAIEGSKAKILDTRKTVPGLRSLQKYAVRCGGGSNHRMNLSQMAMVKDNHLKAVLSPAIQPSGKHQSSHTADGHETQIMRLKSKLPKKTLLVIEAKTVREVELAIQAKADIVLLDNMPPALLRKAIRFVRSNSHALIEVSGGVTLKTVKKIAQSGADRISVGALTHSAPAIDFSMEVC